MADPSLIDDPELQKLNALVLDDPEEFDRWNELVRAAESQEGGLNRNSSPGAIATIRDIYDKFLARFPLFFGYWKKYADLEFAIAGTEAAEMVYERGVASIGTSVDIWANYCGFKVDTSHDPDVLRELFDRGADSVGLDYLSHPFWDKYIEYEERLEAQDRVFAILSRIIRIPMHQYSRYFEHHRNLAARRPVAELAPPDVVARFEAEVSQESAPDAEAALRAKLDAYNQEIFTRTTAETTKRWTYEGEIKRPYFHVTELDDAQLSNWRKYLDFEEGEGDYTRIKFLYERCIVAAANYDEFWMRYARWMQAQEGKAEEVRNIYQRAACIYVPISRSVVRVWYAQFEESVGRPEVAIAILEAILMHLPADVQTIVLLANVYRRHHGLAAAKETLKGYIDNAEIPSAAKGSLVSELARLAWKIGGDVEEARSIYAQNCQQCANSLQLWSSYIDFELDQPTSQSDEEANHKRIKAVYDSVRQSAPEFLRTLSAKYMLYLRERGGKDAMKEFMKHDVEINGPASVANAVSGEIKENGVTGMQVAATAYSRY